jgi:CRP-like cAMP-binding protein
LTEHLSFNVKQRLVNALHDLYINEGSAIKLSHREIADIIGTSIENVSRILKGLKNSGILTIKRGEILVKDGKQLENLTNL